MATGPWPKPCLTLMNGLSSTTRSASPVRLPYQPRPLCSRLFQTSSEHRGRHPQPSLLLHLTPLEPRKGAAAQARAPSAPGEGSRSPSGGGPGPPAAPQPPCWAPTPRTSGPWCSSSREVRRRTSSPVSALGPAHSTSTSRSTPQAELKSVLWERSMACTRYSTTPTSSRCSVTFKIKHTRVCSLCTVALPPRSLRGLLSCNDIEGIE